MKTSRTALTVTAMKFKKLIVSVSGNWIPGESGCHTGYVSFVWHWAYSACSVVYILLLICLALKKALRKYLSNKQTERAASGLSRESAVIDYQCLPLVRERRWWHTCHTHSIPRLEWPGQTVLWLDSNLVRIGLLVDHHVDPKDRWSLERVLQQACLSSWLGPVNNNNPTALV